MRQRDTVTCLRCFLTNEVIEPVRVESSRCAVPQVPGLFQFLKGRGVGRCQPQYLLPGRNRFLDPPALLQGKSKVEIGCRRIRTMPQ